MLTTYDGDVQAVRALRAGALGFLLKSSLRTEMPEAIPDVHRGRSHIYREVAGEIASHVADNPLSEREVEFGNCRKIAGRGSSEEGAQAGAIRET